MEIFPCTGLNAVREIVELPAASEYRKSLYSLSCNPIRLADWIPIWKSHRLRNPKASIATDRPERFTAEEKLEDEGLYGILILPSLKDS